MLLLCRREIATKHGHNTGRYCGSANLLDRSLIERNRIRRVFSFVFNLPRTMRIPASPVPVAEQLGSSLLGRADDGRMDGGEVFQGNAAGMSGHVDPICSMSMRI